MRKRFLTVLMAVMLLSCTMVGSVSAQTQIIWEDEVNMNYYAYLSPQTDMKNGRYYDSWSMCKTFYPGDTVEVDLASDDFDTYLNLYFCFEDGSRLVMQNDDFNGRGTNSHIVYTAKAEGYVTIEVTSSAKRESGYYDLDVYLH